MKFSRLLALVAAALIPTAVLADIPFYQASVAGTALNAQATITPLVGQSTCAVDVEGTFVATIQFQGLVNTTWVPVPGGLITGTSPLSTTVTAPGVYTVSCAGFRAFRATITSFTSGEADISINATPGYAPSNNQNIVGTVTVTNPVTPAPYPSNQAVTVTNTPGVTVQNSPSVLVANTPAVTVANTPGVTVQNTPGVNVLSYPSPVPGTYKNLTASGTTVVKGSPGQFLGIANLSGSIDQITPTTCYDNATAASGNIVSQTTLLHNTSQFFPTGIALLNGLTCASGTTLLGNGVNVFYK